MKYKVYVVDSFTNEPFKGNPAGVCVLDEFLPAETMQAIAAEINASETAFLVKAAGKENTYNILYYSPTVEIAFCGHASLASAKVIFEIHGLITLTFITGKSLKLSAEKSGEKVKMTFPLFKTEQVDTNAALLMAMGIQEPLAMGFNPDLDMLLIELADKNSLLNLNPDFAAMVKADSKPKEVVVTARSTDSQYDFYSRCFCPWIGIDEDPVTGAAHSVLAGYWKNKLNKDQFEANQCSKRGGSMSLKIVGENALEVLGDATIMLEGMIRT